jgi:hypothetical protein
MGDDGSGSALNNKQLFLVRGDFSSERTDEVVS